MTPERWQKIEELYHAALKLEAGQRAAYLQESCQDDVELRHEVESLLAADAQAQSFIESPALEMAAQSLSDAGPPSLVGKKLGAYQILSPLGAGGMGEVYKARDTRLNRIVAIKVLPRHLSERVDLRQRFEREARALARLSHPHICPIHDTGKEDGIDFLVMEYLEGETLARRLKKGAIPLAEAVRYAVEIASALDEAHRHGIIHRDLKPGNIMLTKTGVKLLDFGLAKQTGGAGAPRTLVNARGSARPTQSESLTEEGMILGTLEYMAPEQVEGKQTDARTDIFALGVVIYEMATGKKAFEGNSKASLAAAILTAQPPLITTIQPLTPPTFERVVKSCLAKNPDQRWQSVRDLASELESIAKGLAFDKKPHSWLTSPRWAVAFLLAGLAMVAGLTWWLRLPPPLPKVLGYSQITNESHMEWSPRLVTDGPRLYFTDTSKLQEGYVQILQVSTAGGELSPLRTELPNLDILDISPDGSLILARTFPLGKDYMSECPLWVLPLPSGPPRRLGDLSGHAAAWSPDAQQIAFAREKDLYVAKSDGTQARKLVTLDGRAVLLSCALEGKSVRFTLVGDSTESLWEIFLDGTHLRRLFPDWNFIEGGHWTPDGKYFIFWGNRSVGDQNAIWAFRENGNFTNANPEPVQLSTGPMQIGAPEPSRDGKKIFFVGRIQRHEMVQYDAKIHRFVPYHGGITAETVQISKDGDWVAYVAPPGWSLWRSRTDGSQRLRLTFPPMNAVDPQWSPDHQRIAFVGYLPNRPSKIYVISTDGGIPQQLMPGEWYESAPMWFPDGKRLHFFHAAHFFDPATLEIRWVDLETKKVSTVPDSKGLGSSALSPDGRYIAATPFNSKDKVASLLLFDFETQTWSKLVEGMQFGFRSWSMDSKYLYFFNFPEKRAIYRVRIEDRKLEEVASFDFQLASGFTSSPWLGLTPNGSPLVVRDLSSQDIYALDWEAP